MDPGSEDRSLLSDKSKAGGGVKGGVRQMYFYCTWVLLFLLLGFVVLSLVFIVLFGVATHRANLAAQTCTSAGCAGLTAEVLAALDESQSPCDDFYQFACGGWERVNVIPEGSGSFGSFGALDEHLQKLISKLLDSNVTDTSAAVKKAADFYKSCANTSVIDEAGNQPLVDLLTSVGGWSLAQIPDSRSWNFSQLLQAHLKGGHAFFSMSVTADAKNSTLQSIYLGQSGLSLSKSAYKQPQLTAALLTYMTTVVGLLGGTDSSAVDAAMRRVLELETNISRIFYSNTELRDLGLTYNPMTVQQLNDTYQVDPQLDWLTFLQDYLDVVGKKNLITKDTVVIVDTPSFFGNLSSAFDTFTKDDLDNYVKWTVARAYIPHLSSAFRAAHDKFTAVISGTGESPRYKTCTSAVSGRLQYAVSRLYSLGNVITGTKDKMNQMIDNIQSAFKERLQEKTWLDQPTKTACSSKVDAITRQIAYPDFIFDVPVLDQYYAELSVSSGYFDNINSAHVFLLKDHLSQFGQPTNKTGWGLPPTAINAYYSPSFNQFVFLEGILNPPFFNPDWPDYFLYGAMGVIIGHELSHGFDDQGQKFDAQGNYREWWSAQSQRNFQELTTCFSKQYSGYSVDGYPVNGQLTLGENIADNGGLHTSFQAYKKLTAGQSLPALSSKYNHDQLFFIAFAQVWCTLYTPQYLRVLTENNPHSPGTIRVLGTLSNSPEFAQAFSCPSSSPYNPPADQKCQLW